MVHILLDHLINMQELYAFIKLEWISCQKLRKISYTRSSHCSNERCYFESFADTIEMKRGDGHQAVHLSHTVLQNTIKQKVNHVIEKVIKYSVLMYLSVTCDISKMGRESVCLEENVTNISSF